MSASRQLGPWIALAGLFVGAGLYFGLRALRPDRPANAKVASPPGDAPTAVPVDATWPSAADVDRTIRSAFAPIAERWRASCWDRIVRQAPEPPASVHVVAFAFGPDGAEVMRAINDRRGETRADVATCLRDQPYERLQLAPLGRTVNVELELRFP